MARALEKELLSAEDVAGLMGVKETTVWRWCREGTLPCLKVGKHWRVRREALEAFLRQSEHRSTLVGQLSSFLEVPDSVIAITQNIELLHRLDAAFFRVGEAHDGMLVKFYGSEEHSADELRAVLEENGLEVERLERAGRFLMRPERDPLEASGGRRWGSSWTRGVGKGALCGPPSTGLCRSNWRRPYNSNRS
jgi:excisionase family DNA binding protein